MQESVCVRGDKVGRWAFEAAAQLQGCGDGARSRAVRSSTTFKSARPAGGTPARVSSCSDYTRPHWLHLLLHLLRRICCCVRCAAPAHPMFLMTVEKTVLRFCLSTPCSWKVCRVVRRSVPLPYCGHAEWVGEQQAGVSSRRGGVGEEGGTRGPRAVLGAAQAAGVCIRSSCTDDRC